MKNFIKDKTDLLQKGFLIKPVESKKSLKYINNFFKNRLLKVIKIKKIKKFSFNNLHRYINVGELNSVRLKLIKEMNLDQNFREHLFLLAKKNLYEMVGNELAMQNNINLSIQFPNDESSLLPLHADTWSGDSPFETVVWLPLVNCYKTKSMFILNQNKYNKFVSIYKKKKVINVSNLFEKLKKDLNFIKINYGNYLFFNQSLPHGNIVNKTKETRISINCRFKGLFTPYAEKKLGKFFTPLKIRPASQIGLDYKFPGE
jgi:sporadic carbohydrate cluster 2OG-Fe(II) oxygenase